MKGSSRYVVSQAVSMKLDNNGTLVATSSISQYPYLMRDAEFAVLRAFSTPRVAEEAYAQLSSSETLERQTFDDIVGKLAEVSLLVPVDGAGPRGAAYTPAAQGFDSMAVHHWMLRDALRVQSYRAAIMPHVKDKVVAEVGCGTGILSIFASQGGARKVYAIEESGVAELAAHMFHVNGCDQVSLLLGNSRDIELPEPVDVIIHEILGVDPFYENIVPFIRDARDRFFRDGKGLLIPHKIDVYCVGLEPEFLPSLAVRARLEANEFSGMYGVDFTPYQMLLSTIDEISETDGKHFPRKGGDFREATFEQPILSDECQLRSVDLNGDLDDVDKEARHTMRIHTDGRLGSFLLFFRARLDETQTLSTSPFSPRTHWGWSVRDLSRTMNVKAGDEVELRSEIVSVGGRQRLRVRLA